MMAAQVDAGEYRLYQLNPPVTLGLPWAEEWVLYDEGERRVSIRHRRPGRR